MTGPVQIIFGAERVEKAAFDVWPGGGRKGRGRGRGGGGVASEPTCQQS